MPHYRKGEEYWDLKEILRAKGEYVSVTNIINLGQKLSRMKVGYIKSKTGARMYKKDDLLKHMKNLGFQIDLKENPMVELDELREEESEEVFQPEGQMNVLYSRTTGKSKADADAIAVQNGDVLRYCVANGIKIDRQYCDMCPSYVFGKEKRPGLYELISDILDGQVKCVYVLSPDVISPFFYEFFIELCKMCGTDVDIISKVPTKEAKKAVTAELLSMSDVIKKRFML